MRLSNKITALFLAMLCLFSGTAAAVSFQDISENSYFDAIETLAGLSIMQGYEDGTFKPEEQVTRAEYAAMMLRVLGVPEEWGVESGNFSDVPETHWAYNQVNYLCQMGYLSGYGNGVYGPEDPVALQDALKILVDILGYKVLASKVPYPTGYLAQAGELGLMKKLGGKNYAQPALRGEVAQIIYNAIGVPVYRQTGASESTAIYEKGDDFLKEFLGIETCKGMVTANSVTSLSSEDYLGDGRLRIKQTKTNEEKLFNTGDLNADGFLGYQVLAFSKADEAGDQTLIYLKKDENKNYGLTITADQFFKYDNRTITYYADPENKDRELTAKVLFGADVIYNGVYTPFDESLFSLQSGSMELIDSDSDSLYDIIKINACTVTVVDKVSTSAYTIIDRYSASNNVIYDDSDTTDLNKLIKYDINLPMAALEKDDVLEVYQSKNTTGRKVNIINVLDSSVKGVINQVSDEWITIGDKSYKLSQYFKDNSAKIGSLPLGITETFLLDSNGCVVAPKTKNISTLQYGFLVGAMPLEGLEEGVTLKIFSEKGEMGQYVTSGKLVMDAVRTSDPEAILDGLRTAKYGFPQGQGDLSQVVRFQVNSDNEIKTLDTVNPDVLKDENGKVFIDETALSKEFEGSNIKYGGNAFEGNILSSSTVVFNIPENLTKTEDYKILSVAGLLVEKPYNVSCYDRNESGKLGCLTVTGEVVPSIENDNPLYMVKKLTDTVNSEGDIVKKLYVLNCKADGTEEEYIFTEKSILSDYGYSIKNPIASDYGNEKYPLRPGDVIRLSVGSGKISKLERLFSVDQFKLNLNVKTKENGFLCEINAEGAENPEYAYLLRFLTTRVMYKDSGTALVQFMNPAKPASGTVEGPKDVYWSFEGNSKFGKPKYVVYEEKDNGQFHVRSGSFNDINDADASGSKASYLFAKSRYGTVQEVFIFNFQEDPFGN